MSPSSNPSPSFGLCPSPTSAPAPSSKHLKLKALLQQPSQHGPMLGPWTLGTFPIINTRPMHSNVGMFALHGGYGLVGHQPKEESSLKLHGCCYSQRCHLYSPLESSTQCGYRGLALGELRLLAPRARLGAVLRPGLTYVYIHRTSTIGGYLNIVSAVSPGCPSCHLGRINRHPRGVDIERLMRWKEAEWRDSRWDFPRRNGGI